MGRGVGGRVGAAGRASWTRLFRCPLTRATAAAEATETRHSIVEYGQPRHREASSVCFPAPEATSSRLSVKSSTSSGDFLLFRRRRGSAAQTSGGRGGGSGGGAGHMRADGSVRHAAFADPSRLLRRGAARSAPSRTQVGVRLAREGGVVIVAFNYRVGDSGAWKCGGSSSFPTQVGFRGSADERKGGCRHLRMNE